jgi:uncharacterized protein YndB with AHSA1/START domain
MATEFTVSATIPASPKQVYDAWLSTKGHTQMTEAGGQSVCARRRLIYRMGRLHLG